MFSIAPSGIILVVITVLLTVFTKIFVLVNVFCFIKPRNCNGIKSIDRFWYNRLFFCRKTKWFASVFILFQHAVRNGSSIINTWIKSNKKSSPRKKKIAMLIKDFKSHSQSKTQMVPWTKSYQTFWTVHSIYVVHLYTGEFLLSTPHVPTSTEV